MFWIIVTTLILQESGWWDRRTTSTPPWRPSPTLTDIPSGEIHTAFSLVQSFRVLKYFHDFCYAIKLVLYDKKSRWTKIVQQSEALDQWDSSNVGARPIRMLYSGHSPPDTTPTSCSGDPMRCPPAFSTETQTVPIISCSGDSPAVIELL